MSCLAHVRVQGRCRCLPYAADCVCLKASILLCVRGSTQGRRSYRRRTLATAFCVSICTFLPVKPVKRVPGRHPQAHACHSTRSLTTDELAVFLDQTHSSYSNDAAHKRLQTLSHSLHDHIFERLGCVKCVLWEHTTPCLLFFLGSFPPSLPVPNSLA